MIEKRVRAKNHLIYMVPIVCLRICEKCIPSSLAELRKAMWQLSVKCGRLVFSIFLDPGPLPFRLLRSDCQMSKWQLSKNVTYCLKVRYNPIMTLYIERLVQMKKLSSIFRNSCQNEACKLSSIRTNWTQCNLKSEY